MPVAMMGYVRYRQVAEHLSTGNSVHPPRVNKASLVVVFATAVGMTLVATFPVCLKHNVHLLWSYTSTCRKSWLVHLHDRKTNVKTLTQRVNCQNGLKAKPRWSSTLNRRPISRLQRQSAFWKMSATLTFKPMTWKPRWSRATAGNTAATCFFFTR